MVGSDWLNVPAIDTFSRYPRRPVGAGVPSTPTYTPQNDTLVALIILNTPMWGLWGKQIQGEGKFRPGTISLGIISPGENFATLEIPKAPSAIRPNDGDNTTGHAPDRDSKIATHHHNKQAPAPPAPILPDQQHQIPYICTRNGWLRRVGKRLGLLRKHNPSAPVAKDGTVPPKISPGENFATVLNGEIFPAKFSPGKIFPPPVPTGGLVPAPIGPGSRRGPMAARKTAISGSVVCRGGQGLHKPCRIAKWSETSQCKLRGAGDGEDHRSHRKLERSGCGCSSAAKTARSGSSSSLTYMRLRDWAGCILCHVRQADKNRPEQDNLTKPPSKSFRNRSTAWHVIAACLGRLEGYATIPR